MITSNEKFASVFIKFYKQLFKQTIDSESKSKLHQNSMHFEANKKEYQLLIYNKYAQYDFNYRIYELQN